MPVGSRSIVFDVELGALEVIVWNANRSSIRLRPNIKTVDWFCAALSQKVCFLTKKYCVKVQFRIGLIARLKYRQVQIFSILDAREHVDLIHWLQQLKELRDGQALQARVPVCPLYVINFLRVSAVPLAVDLGEILVLCAVEAALPPSKRHFLVDVDILTLIRYLLS